MWPTSEEERNLAASRWRRMPLAAEIAFFMLTLLAVAATYWLCDVLHFPKGWVTLIGSLATAEWLIRGHRFWRTGVESALWIGGLLAFIFSLPSSGKPEAILVFVAAFAIAGWRLRNPLFGTIAVILADVYLAVKDWDWVALIAGVIVSAIAGAATTRAWRRKSNELLVDMLAVVMPVATYVTYLVARNDSEIGVVLLFVALAIADLAIGIAFRERAPLIATFACIAIACFEARDFIHISLEARFILGGAAMLAAAASLMRALRNRTTGIVVTPVKEGELREAMQIAAMLPLATPSAPQQEAGMQTGGGQYGGGGASGDFR